MKKRIILVTWVIAAFTQCKDDKDVLPENPADMPYELTINPNNFESENITGNEFFPLTEGKTYTFEGKDESGKPSRTTEEHLSETKVVMGVTCVVVRARGYVNDNLIEDTNDFYAQDKQGNVWYFGEDTKEIENGNVVSTEGSWEAGVDGALPGIIMFAHPLTGTWYRQEFYKGKAEDVAQILSMEANANVPYGNYTNVLKTAEWSPLEPGTVEDKFYASGVGIVKTETVKGDTSFEELVSIQ